MKNAQHFDVNPKNTLALATAVVSPENGCVFSDSNIACLHWQDLPKAKIWKDDGKTEKRTLV